MKKTKILVLVLAAAIMLMGAGYALWSEVIPMNATVNSTYLNIGLEKEFYTEYLFEENLANDLEDYGTECIVKFEDNGRGKATNNSKANVFFKNLFPGVTQTAIVKFVNDSKIPVQLQQVKYSDVTGDAALLTDTTIETYSWEKDNGVPCNLHDLKNKTFAAGGNPDIIPSVVLEPGEFLTYKIVVKLGIGSTNDTQLKSFGFDIEHTWQQQTDVVAGY